MKSTTVAEHVTNMHKAENQSELADAAAKMIAASHDNVIKAVEKVESKLESRHRWVIGLIIGLCGLMVALRVFPPAPSNPQVPVILQIPANPQALPIPSDS